MAAQLNYSACQANAAINRYYNLKIKLALLSKDIWFNNQCLKNNVIPNYVSIKTASNSKAALKAINLGRITWVKQEIKYLYAKKQTLNQEINKLHVDIIDKDFEGQLVYFKDRYVFQLNNKLRVKQNVLNKKLDQLISKKMRNENTFLMGQGNQHTFYKRTENLTNINFSLNETRVLDKGLKHNLSDSYENVDNMKQTIIDCERALSYVDPKDRNHVRHLIGEKLNQIKHSKIKIDKSEKQTILSLKKKLKDNEILALKSDKGNTTVLMTKTDYINKTNDFITENGIKQIKKDPTTSYQNKIKLAVKNTALIMNANDKRKVINSNPKAPNMRALPKIHKPNVPIRPVVNYRGAPAYKLACFLQRYLKDNIDLPNNKSVINSQDVVNRLKHVVVNHEDRFLSLDVVSMYTCVPVKDTLVQIEKLLLQGGANTLEVNETIVLLRLVLNQNYFQFNNNFYIQEEGLGMGNPLSGILADIYLNFKENEIINEIMKVDQSLIWLRYVDDIWAKYNSSTTNSQFIVDKCNELSQALKFTKEDEVNGRLNYLDIAMVREKDKIITGVFRKPTTTSHTLNRLSNHPEQHLQAAYRCYINRAIGLSSNNTNKNKELRIINQLALENGFDHKWINKIKSKISKGISNNGSNSDNKKFAKFTYINKQTIKVTQIFANRLKMKIAYKTNNNVKSYIGAHNLNSNNPYDSSGIYKLVCLNKDCPKNYVGRTGRCFKTRFSEHRMSVRYNRPSAFGQHAEDEQHDFGPIEDNMVIIKKMEKGIDLNTAEAIEIFLSKDDVNNLNEQDTNGHNAMFPCLNSYFN